MAKKTIRMATKSLPRGDWDQHRWDDFLKDKEVMLEEIFAEADRQKLDNKTLAAKAGLAYTTIYNMDRYFQIVGKHTSSPLLSTIWKLARAVGLKFKVERKQAKHKRRRAA